MGAIRLFLSYAVVLEHFNQQVLASYHIDFNPLWSASINGGRAVLLFYVVSGFLISYVLHEKYGTDRAGTLAFYRSRFLQIYPLWWAVLAFAVLFDLWRHSSDPLPSNPLPAIALYSLDWIIPLWKFPAFDWSVVPYRVAIGWTLGAEVTFYLMAPFVLRSNRLAIGLLLSSAAIRTIILLFVARGSPGYVNLTLFFFPATLLFFLLGHFGAIFCRHRPIGLVGSLGLLCAAMALSYHAVNQVTFDDWIAQLSPLCFALALPGIFAATKDVRLFNFLGDLTYPLYLSHSLTFVALFWPLKQQLDHWTLPMIQSKAAVPILMIGVLLAALGALATRYLVEPPARFVASQALALVARLGLWLGSQRAKSDSSAPVLSQGAGTIVES